MTDFETSDKRLTRSETITALTHYYRAESARSLAWRERLDRTTNWAVGATAAFLGFGFSHPEFNHSFFLFGLSIVYILLIVEARRYRFYDAYEYRVRLLHQHFIYGVLNGSLEMQPGSFWVAELASDLRYPQYKMPMSHALGRRLYANYGYLFAVLLAGWLVKIQVHPLPVGNWTQFLKQAAVGPLKGWLVLGFILAFVVHLVLLAVSARRQRGGRDLFCRLEDRPSPPPDSLEES